MGKRPCESEEKGEENSMYLVSFTDTIEKIRQTKPDACKIKEEKPGMVAPL